MLGWDGVGWCARGKDGRGRRTEDGGGAVVVVGFVGCEIDFAQESGGRGWLAELRCGGVCGDGLLLVVLEFADHGCWGGEVECVKIRKFLTALLLGFGLRGEGCGGG